MRYLFDPANIVTVGGIGALTGILGLLIGIVGFAITLRQLYQVQTVAEGQRLAIASLKLRINELNIIEECGKAERALNELKSHLFRSDDDIPLSIFDAFASSLITIRDATANLDVIARNRLQRTIEEIDRLSEQATGSVKRAAHAKQAAQFRDYHGLLVLIRAQIQERQKV